MIQEMTSSLESAELRYIFLVLHPFRGKAHRQR